jgi:hypothetical protein
MTFNFDIQLYMISPLFVSVNTLVSDVEEWSAS